MLGKGGHSLGTAPSSLKGASIGSLCTKLSVEPGMGKLMIFLLEGRFNPTLSKHYTPAKWHLGKTEERQQAWPH